MVVLARRRSSVFVEGVYLEEETFESRNKGRGRSPLELFKQLIIKRDVFGHEMVMVPEGAYQSCYVVIPKMARGDSDSARLLQAKKMLLWEGAEPQVTHVASDFLGDREGSYVVLSDWRKVRSWCGLVEQHGGVTHDATV
ncbi:MAG: hypothetical protein C0404_03340, partial [Verrucomicrobia bacterium]|nr:hypothetical protein [Verrucomicrobiota bacterium]